MFAFRVIVSAGVVFASRGLGVGRVQFVRMMTLAGKEAGQGAGCQNKPGLAKE